MSVTLPDFLARFTYRKGLPSLFGRDIRRSATGDCGAFAWTVLLILEGGLWGAIMAHLRGRAKLVRVKSPVNGFLPRHVALWHRDYGWIDSTVRQWRWHPMPHSVMWPTWVEKGALIVALGFAAKVWGLW